MSPTMVIDRKDRQASRRGRGSRLPPPRFSKARMAQPPQKRRRNFPAPRGSRDAVWRVRKYGAATRCGDDAAL